MRKALIVLIAFVFSGCAAWQTVKPVVRTIDDQARDMCTMYFGGLNGISWEDAARKYCKTREDIAPWLDQLLEAKVHGDAAAMGVELPAPEAPCVEPPQAAPTAVSIPQAPVPTPEPESSAAPEPGVPPAAPGD